MNNSVPINPSKHALACKFVCMLYRQGKLPFEIYEQFCSTYFRKVKDVNE